MLLGGIKYRTLWLGLTASLSLILLVVSLIIPVNAQSASCSVAISPGQTSPGEDLLYAITITNTGTSDLIWADILAPANFLYSGQAISQDDWFSNNIDNGINVYNGSIAAGNNYTFSVSAKAGVSTSSGVWRIESSANADGSDKSLCNGNFTTAVAGHLPNESDNGISNLSISEITASTATITWDSDVDTTSIVYYGLSSGYGSTSKHVTNHDNAHSVTLTGLNPATKYHFQVAGQDTSLNSYYSADASFVTGARAAVPIAEIIQNQITNRPVSNRPVIAITPGAETIKPTIALATALPRVVKQAPVLSGSAEDNKAIARVDYSIDGGRNWLPVTAVGLGKSKVSFTFTPQLNVDGNYDLVIRAIDTSGNTVQTPSSVIVFDKIPPIFGNLAVTFGPQILETDGTGSMNLAANSAYRLTGQAVGGATEVSVITADTKGMEQTSELTQDTRSGLWTGMLKISKPGNYSVSVVAVDGADNRTKRQLGAVIVDDNGSVSDSKGKPVKNAVVTLYYMEPSSKRWTVWDGKPYSQQNPQPVKGSSYSLMAPAGEYYLKAAAKNFGSVYTERFTLNKAQNINQKITLSDHALMRFGNFAIARPAWPKLVEYQAPKEGEGQNVDSLVGSALPQFKLLRIGGGEIQKADLFGRPTVMTLLDTWSPGSTEQFAALASVQRNRDVGVYPVFEGQSRESVESYLRLANSNLTGIVDPTNSLAESLRAGFGPKHLFIDRTGHIKKVMVGVLSEEQILQELGGN